MSNPFRSDNDSKALFDKANLELFGALARLDGASKLFKLCKLGEPETVVATLNQMPFTHWYTSPMELGQLAEDGTFRKYSGSFGSWYCGRLLWVMHDSNHWYRVNLRLFVWNELIVGELNVLQDPSRTVISNTPDPYVSKVPPEYTLVIVKW